MQRVRKLLSEEEKARANERAKIHYQKYKGTEKFRVQRRASASRYRARYPEKVRETWLRWKYGIGCSDYEQMLAEQGGGCAICHSRKPGSKRKHFCVDHCHETGFIRGLLCLKCNSMIASHGDTLERVRAFIAYLERSCVDGRVIGLEAS